MAKTTGSTPSKHNGFINRAIFVVAAVEPLSTLPQAITVYAHHSAAGVSILSWVSFLAFDVIWLWYGVVEKQKALIVSGVLYGLVEAAVTVGALLYGGSL